MSPHTLYLAPILESYIGRESVILINLFSIYFDFSAYYAIPPYKDECDVSTIKWSEVYRRSSLDLISSSEVLNMPIMYGMPVSIHTIT